MAHIFLYGPPGAGKSTAGRLLADQLRLPFIDLDQAIESVAGAGIPQIIAVRGEEAFRELESGILKDQVAQPESVIALGGGTLLCPANRSLVEGQGIVVCLSAGPEVLLGRLQREAGVRPLLEGDLPEKLDSLLAGRASHYASFPLQVNSEHSALDTVSNIQAMTGRFHLTAMGEYDVLVEQGGMERIGELLRARGLQNSLVVTDENILGLHAPQVLDSLRRSGLQSALLSIPAGEAHKNLRTVERLWHGFLEAGLDRTSTVLALGGGVVGDLAGFAASTFMRGLAWVGLPTTLLSMVDASLGGKTGFDLPEGKNLVGAFHPPRLVLADPQVLSTLPDSEFRAGMAEVVKHGVIADPELFALCERGPDSIQQDLSSLLRRAMAVKIRMIERDPYEQGERAALNLGHTVGHAVELVSRFCVRHGEAVSMGMVAEARLAERMGLAQPGLSERIAGCLKLLGLPVEIPPDLARSELVHAMRSDKKKAAGVVRFSLPVEIGRVQVNVEVKNLELAFEED